VNGLIIDVMSQQLRQRVLEENARKKAMQDADQERRQQLERCVLNHLQPTLLWCTLSLNMPYLIAITEPVRQRVKRNCNCGLLKCEPRCVEQESTCDIINVLILTLHDFHRLTRRFGQQLCSVRLASVRSMSALID